MIDRDRIQFKLDQLDGYLRELGAIVPERFEEYLYIEKKRACERLVQIIVEAIIDTCTLLVAGLRLGLPGEEDDLFEKLAMRGVITRPMAGTLKRMKGLRNLLVHEYWRINDELVFRTIRERLGDCQGFRREILVFLRQNLPQGPCS